MDHKKAAQQLWDAEQGRYQIDMLTLHDPDMTVEDAYAVQLENVRRREEMGQKVIGMKIGLTSTGMQKLLNVNEPDYGHLFDNMLLLERDTCSMSRAHPAQGGGGALLLPGQDPEGPRRHHRRRVRRHRLGHPVH